MIAASNPSRSRLTGTSGSPAPNSVRVLAFLGLALAPVFVLSACQPNLHIGRWTCAADGAANATDINSPVAIPWSTGFENGFCDYVEAAGFCYDPSPATYEVVTSPVHTGQYAAAFRVHSSSSGDQARCVRQGALPTTAYYGAWYYIPTAATNAGNWNLLHFTGGPDLTDHNTTLGWLDLSLVSANGGLRAAVFLGAAYTSLGEAGKFPSIPIGSWFHLQLYIDREPNGAGEVRFYQDGQQVFDATNVTTDVSPLGQWYVGNLADGLTPADSTLYVDDVTISAVL